MNTSNNSLVTIVVPVFNTKAYIERCFRSIAEQTYKNFEVIFIDDGSSDGSLKECITIINKHENVRLIKHETNMGQEATRNDGIRASKGEWLLFLDSDDTLEKNALQELVDVAKFYHSDIVMFDFTYFVKSHKMRVGASIKPGQYPKENFVKNLLTDLSWSFISCIGSKLYNVRFLKQNHLLFDIKYKFNEDGAFALEAIEKANTIYYLSKPFYNYILRDGGSIQTSYRNKMYSTVRNVHLLLEHIIKEYDCGKRVHNQFYLLCAQFIRVCLRNEKQFKGYKSFKELFKIFKHDDLYNSIAKKPFLVPSFKYRVFLFLFRINLKSILYLIT